MQIELTQPLVEELFHSLPIQELDLVFIGHQFFDLPRYYSISFLQVLLELYALGDDVAAHGLLFEALELGQALFFGLLAALFEDVLAPAPDGVHEFRLKQVVKGVQLEALAEQLDVDFAGETHEAYCLVLDLRHEGFVVGGLGCDELGDEVLSIGFSDSLTLAVEHVGKVIVIFLAGVSHLDEGQDKHSGGEEDSGAEVDATHVFEDLSVDARHLFEVVLYWVEAVVNVFFICIAA